MQKKILTFVVYRKKILALYSEPHPEHGEGGWFVVTGAIEKGESPEDAVKREVKEETGLVVKEVSALNWGSIYNWRGDICKEYNFVSFIKQPRKIILNKEHSKYKWLDIDNFIEIIKWDDDKKLLKRVLEKALNKETYFKKIAIKNYRKEKNE
jgi:8-oxo-dGTP pyrophosphatase MutT (NUDIX family)